MANEKRKSLNNTAGMQPQSKEPNHQLVAGTIGAFSSLR
jgi:hypothetical protein